MEEEESVTAMQVEGAGADAKIEASLRAVDVTENEGGGTFCSALACGAVPEVTLPRHFLPLLVAPPRHLLDTSYTPPTHW